MVMMRRQHPVNAHAPSPVDGRVHFVLLTLAVFGGKVEFEMVTVVPEDIA